MSLSALLSIVASDPAISAAVDDARSRTVPALDLTGPPALRPFLAAALADARPVLLVTATYREAEDQAATLASILGEDQVAYYPAWETLPHERLSPRSDTVGRRLSVLRRLAGNDQLPAPKVVVAPVRALLQPQVKGLAQMRPVRITVGADIDPEALVRDLAAAAYTRVDLVERRGEFAVRGGIVDVFSPTEEHPIRIDFLGDTVEEIRSFTVADQRSTGDPIAEVIISPCREMLITDEVRGRAASLIADHGEIAEMLERISNGHAVEGMESLAPALVDGMELMIDVMPSDTQVLICDPELIRGRSVDLMKMSAEFLATSWQAAAAGGKAPIDLAASAYRNIADVRTEALGRGLGWWSLSPFASAPHPGADDPVSTEPVRTEDGEIVDLGDVGELAGVETRSINARGVQPWRGDVAAAVGDIRQALSAGWRVVMSAEGAGLAKRMVELLGEHEIPARQLGPDADTLATDLVNVIIADLPAGFIAEASRLAVFTASDLSGQRNADKSQRRMPSRRKNQIDPLQLAPGDAVVHEQHGVGRYLEMVQRSVQNATREYLVIEYAPAKRGQPGDRLFVPMDQLDQVTRYVGGENPSLDKMGGADWAKRKGRARKAVRQIAAELIKLYAARQATRGHAFGPDTTWQAELEDAFNYVETPDQLAAVTEVKADMEQLVPMDRLICGDVGYGKTEIAVRAAFKAVQDGKQVAILVPTTLLAQQHYATFADRYAGFPIKVAALSRFATAADARKTTEGITDGSVDVVVGTHRLLSGEIKFKDLGLVIIDEEQRFGVEHKEALKRLRMDVDVLAMSATPIPRTLEMAITGIREMSTIATPPEERHPVLTFAGPYDEAQVAAAIRRELMREGQVFYIHNRVQSIEKTAKHIAELVPEARVVSAHGQMSEQRLEQVMVDFWERRADVLVCTTIVEAGLDISSANTLIIERADLLGLSQLHQLRGRVGRGRERGYAYLLYPPERALTETAHDRLATMAANADLGAGMQIAMKDLEIRGAGNLLGGEQSGHIADVGFDLYIRLVGEAVADFRGTGGEPEPEVRIELPVDAHLPHAYIETERLRLEMYRRLAETRTEEDLAATIAEMTDRYGEPSGPVLTLIAVARFRLAARAAGLAEVVAQGNFIRFGPADLPESRTLRLKRLHPRAVIKDHAKIILIPRPMAERVGGSPPSDDQLLDWATGVVTEIFAPVLAPAAG